MRLAILAPVGNSPFALAVAELARREPGVELVAIVVRRIVNPGRLRNELRRDGVRLLRKVWRKLVVGAPPAHASERGFHAMVGELGLPHTSLGRFARAHGIECLKVRDHNDPAAVELLGRARPDVVAFTGGGLIRRALLEVAGQGIFNTHMGILPEYRGMDVVEWPLLEDRHETVGLGVTLHLIDRGVDTGPIVTARRVPIAEGDTLETLRTRFEPAMVELMMEGVRRTRDGRLEVASQRAEAGRQYFVLHPRLHEEVRRRLARASARVGNYST